MARMLGMGMGYEISTSQMQYDAADKAMYQQYHCQVHLRECGFLQNVEKLLLRATIADYLRWKYTCK